MNVSMDSLPTDPIWSRHHQGSVEGVLSVDAQSTKTAPEKEAGATTDDPHHPAQALPFNVYTICGVVASINRYILRLLMQKPDIVQFRKWLLPKKSLNSSAWQVET